MHHRSQPSAPAKRRRLSLLKTLTILLALMLVAAACGGQKATPAAPATPTLIATLAAPEPIAAATLEVAATETPVAAEAVAATEGVTASEEITATEETTAGEAITETAAVTPSEEATTTEEVAGAEEITGTEEVTSTEAVTGTEEITGTEEMTAAAELTASEELTTAEEITPAEEMTATAEAGHVHGATTAEAPAATEEITATEAISAGEEVSGTQGATPLLPATEGAASSQTAEETGEAEGTGEAVAGEARVFFLQPTTNAVIPITSTVVIGYEGVEVQAAGAVQEGAGHLHILVDEDFVEAGQGMPADAGHLHLGDGSAETELVLTPGSHVLRLQFANGAHIALAGDQYRDEIYVNVVDRAPEESVRFAMPTDGAVVPLTFDVVMAASGLSVQPSGAVVEDSGHLHLLIDQDFVAAGEIIPEDETHLHFGEGQLTGTVTLEPGEHTLRLQFADGEHRALEGDQYRAEITVTADEAAEATRVMFVAPEDGATVTSPVPLVWAATGVIVESAGQVVRPEGGHLHLLINKDFVPAGEVIPTSATSLHFGRGQTSAEVSLSAGEYTLRLQMADGAHIAKDGDQYRDEITITVNR